MATPKPFFVPRDFNEYPAEQFVIESIATVDRPGSPATARIIYNSTLNVFEYYGGDNADWYQFAAMDAVSAENELIVASDPTTETSYKVKPWGGSDGFVTVSSAVVSTQASINIEDITTGDLESSATGDTVGEQAGLSGQVDHLVTAKAVDEAISASAASLVLNFTDGDTVGVIDLDPTGPETLSILGTTAEILTDVEGGVGGNTIRIGLPDTIQVLGNITGGAVAAAHTLWGDAGANNITIGQSTSTVVVEGDLTVNGTTTTQNVDEWKVEDPLIHLGINNGADSLDIGIKGEFTDVTTKYTALYRDASNSGVWVLASEATEAAGVITPTTYGTFQLGELRAGVASTQAGAIKIYDDSHAYVASFQTSASQSEDTAYTLPIALASTDNFILTSNTSGVLSWENQRVAVDAAGTPGYLGVAYNDGVLRTDQSISVTDGGDYITLGMDIHNISTTETTLEGTDLIAFSDESAVGDPTKKITVENLLSAISGVTGGGASTEVAWWSSSSSIDGSPAFKWSEDLDELYLGYYTVATTTSYPATLTIFGNTASGEASISFASANDVSTVTYTWPTSATANGFLKTDASGNLSWDTTAGDITGTKELTFTAVAEAGGWAASGSDWVITLLDSGAAGNGQQNHSLGTGEKWMVEVWSWDATSSRYANASDGVIVEVGTTTGAEAGYIFITAGEKFQGKVNLIAMDQ